MRRSSLVHAALAWLSFATACGGERQESSTSAQAGAGTSAGSGAGTPTTSAAGSGGAAGTGTGTGGDLPQPTPPECACLTSAGDEACRACIDAAGLDGCEVELEACTDDGASYCELVLDCLAFCPTADAFCVETCLGSEDEARAAVEDFAACACASCADECGEGDCG